MEGGAGSCRAHPGPGPCLGFFPATLQVPHPRSAKATGGRGECVLTFLQLLRSDTGMHGHRRSQTVMDGHSHRGAMATFPSRLPISHPVCPQGSSESMGRNLTYSCWSLHGVPWRTGCPSRRGLSCLSPSHGHSVQDQPKHKMRHPTWGGVGGHPVGSLPWAPRGGPLSSWVSAATSLGLLVHLLLNSATHSGPF